MMSDIEIHYDLTSFILENGSIADKLRLVAAHYDIPDETMEQFLSNLEDLLNSDGGVPFALQRGNPSSVKETAEIIPLIMKFRDKNENLIQKMIQFLVSRQKGDGGFGETLNLDPHIEDKWGASTGREFYPVGVSITWLTAKALEAICIANYEDEERIRRARDYLLYRQHEDGHWPDFDSQDVSDPLATGNIVSALRAAGVDSDHKVFKDGRAALFQHLKDSLENESTDDMVDLFAVGKPSSGQESEVLKSGLILIVQAQNEDGGWSPLGTKKSDPELSSILGFVLKVCGDY